jgi:RNA ligase (TIGR02306 family)
MEKKMSTHRVEVVKIDEILPHDNADRLSLAKISGWQVVIGKDNFQVGDLVLYIPVDSILPNSLEMRLFPPGSKITLKKGRIRSIKIRGQMSQGMIIPLNEVKAELAAIGKFEELPINSLGQSVMSEGDDFAELLGIIKYEPPEPEFGGGKGTKGKVASKNQINPNFKKYTDIENIKWYTNVFEDGEQVYISEKLHGTSARYGYVPRHYEGFLAPVRAAVMNFLAKLDIVKPYQFVYGSRNCQLHTGSNTSWYEEDVYSKILKQEDIQAKLQPGECVYGEIVGFNIQKNYTYGCKEGEHEFFVYDVMVNGLWLDYPAFIRWCSNRGFMPVPRLYVGPWSQEVHLKHRDGKSTIGGQKIREGIVIKPVVDANSICGRKVLKSISEAYYLEDNTAYH